MIFCLKYRTKIFHTAMEFTVNCKVGDRNGEIEALPKLDRKVFVEKYVSYKKQAQPKLFSTQLKLN